MKQSFRFTFSTTHIIMMGFLAVILFGSALLALPISSQSGVSVPYIDALFTATAATCVTGLMTVPVFSTWNLFGQGVILLLIQIGGLGVITVTIGAMLMLQQKMGLRDVRLIGDSFNLQSLEGLAHFVKRVILGTACVEGAGAILYMTVFVPEFGVHGIWIAVFNAVPAFCNAGIDVVAADSLCRYAENPMINIVTELLAVLGGLGYIVWWDLDRVQKNAKRQGIKSLRALTLHSKIVLTSTAALILGGAVLFFVLEYHNPLTIGNKSLFGKIQSAFFQSVTTRSAGFVTMPQENLTDASTCISMLLMLIGGSPSGTAGGIKTVTFMVLAATAWSAISGKNEVTLFQRSLTHSVIRKSVAIMGMTVTVAFVSAILLTICTDAALFDVLYETVSATTTVGLTRNTTAAVNMCGKMILIATMFFGRVGPISLAVAFKLQRTAINIIKNPSEEISVG